MPLDYEKAIAFLRYRHAGDPELRRMDENEREAEMFRRILAELPIAGTPAESRLAGFFGIPEGAPGFDLPPDVVPDPGIPDEFTVLREQLQCAVTIATNHTTLDYELVLTQGLSALAGAAPNPAQRTALLAVTDFAQRYAERGFDLCRRVPAQPAATFAEALQSVLLLQALTGISEYCFASISLGRLDQYCFPYFERDRRNGVPESELEAVLTEFLQMLNVHGDYAKALNLGGLNTQGQDGFNDLSRMILRIATRLRLPAPLLAVRCTESMRDEDLALATRPELFTIGQPTFYGEENCRRTLQKRGVPAADLDRWCVNSCMGLMIAGREFSDMWAVVFNALPGLEAAVNGGRPFRPYGPVVATPARYGNIDELIEVMLEYDRLLLRQLMKRHAELNAAAFQTPWWHPSPLVSALLSGGVPGADRLHGGPRYHTGNVDLFALVNTADALCAIDELVFQRKTHTLEEITAAARNNFAGAEALRLELLACPKFGNGDPAADGFTARLATRLARIIREENPAGGIHYMPSFHTLNGHVYRGAAYGAGCDGRRAGEPFAKNIGPMQGRNREGISGVIRSAGAIDQTDFPGGQALDIYCDRAMYRTDAALAKFRSMLRTYFELGGLQLQVNAVSIEELEAALKEPELHEDLTVRIGGFSMRFNHLDLAVRREMIERFQHNT